MSGLSQSFINGETAVEPRIVDQTLPAYGRARFLKINPHDDTQIAGMLIAQLFETSGIGESSVGIVNRAWSHDDDQAIVFPSQNARNIRAASADGIGGFIRQRKFFAQDRGRQQRAVAIDAKVESGLHIS